MLKRDRQFFGLIWDLVEQWNFWHFMEVVPFWLDQNGFLINGFWTMIKCSDFRVRLIEMLFMIHTKNTNLSIIIEIRNPRIKLFFNIYVPFIQVRVSSDRIYSPISACWKQTTVRGSAWRHSAVDRAATPNPSGRSFMEYTTTPWYLSVSSVILPNPALVALCP